ncbi:MAG: hypothetical protein FJW38_09455 [Acidobacteria bacterium]|nr:hypothetical protein [Acidobacteriota bacterium]
MHVNGLPPIGSIAIASAGKFMLAVGRDGSLWTWSANEHGQLGDGTRVSSPVPKSVRRCPKRSRFRRSCRRGAVEITRCLCWPMARCGCGGGTIRRRWGTVRMCRTTGLWCRRQWRVLRARRRCRQDTVISSCC